jgi:hypothetical protein
MAMDKGAEISLCLQHKDQIEGNNSATSVAFEDALVHGAFATLAAPLTLQNLLKYDTYAYVASQDVKVIVHQNLSEYEGNIAKLRERMKPKASCVFPPTMTLRVQTMKT